MGVFLLVTESISRYRQQEHTMWQYFTCFNHKHIFTMQHLWMLCNMFKYTCDIVDDI